MSYPDPGLSYESAMAQNLVRRGPLRFEEGVATDTDIPNEFGRGAYGDTQGNGRGRPMAYSKSPAETMRERAHMGSASWVEAPGELSEFVQGAFADHPSYEKVAGTESRHPSPEHRRRIELGRLIPFLNRTPGSPISQSGRVGPGTAGRPIAYRAKFAIRPVTNDPAGFKQINQTPEAIKSAHMNYLKSGQLPPSLQPKRALPRVLQDRKNKAISRGWRKPLDGRK